MAIRSPHRDALRILFILLEGSSRLPASASEYAVAHFKGEARLHAFDFWIRNPDYLAEELLDIYESTSEHCWLNAAGQIFEEDEPDIRRLPMIRYRFGAFERLDDTLALLRSRDLVRIQGEQSGGKVRVWNFFLPQRAFDLAGEIIREFPVLEWYRSRAALVAAVAGNRGGDALKTQQYKRIEYAETTLGGVIPPITERVMQRLTALKQRVA